MSQIDRTTTDSAPIFHPASHYASPADVLNDQELSTAEKRVILSSWASDMYAVESCPWLRDVPGIGHHVRLSDIIAALRRLDDHDDPPPGGISMRARPPAAMRDAIAASGGEAESHFKMIPPIDPPERSADGARITQLRPATSNVAPSVEGAPRADERMARIRAAENNIRRYSRLLKTELTELERRFVERRLREERAEFDALFTADFSLSSRRRVLDGRLAK